MREICAIPGMDGQLNEVAGRIGAEMTSLGFAEARFDRILRLFPEPLSDKIQK